MGDAIAALSTEMPPGLVHAAALLRQTPADVLDIVEKWIGKALDAGHPDLAAVIQGDLAAMMQSPLWPAPGARQ